MKRALKWFILGGILGGAIVAVKSMQSDEPSDDMPKQVATAAGGTAVACGLLGFVLDRRARRKAKKVAKVTMAISAARAAGPVIEMTAKRTRKAARNAAKAAGPVVGQAASAAREQAVKVAEAARPVVEQAAAAAREQAAARRAS